MKQHGGNAPSESAKAELKLNRGYVPHRLPEGVVTGVWGGAFRIDGGELQPLLVGDVVRKGVVILTEQDGIVMIEPSHPVRVLHVALARVLEVRPPAPESAPVKAKDLPCSVTVTGEHLYVARVEEAVTPNEYVFLGHAALPDVPPARVSGGDDKVVVDIGGRDVVESAGYALFSITLSSDHSSPIQIRLGLLDGSAKIPGDFLSQMEFSADGENWSAVSDGLIELQPGVVAAYVRVPVVNDQLHENTEQFELTAKLVGGQALLAQSASLIATSIVDDDATPVLKISAIQPVLNEQAGVATFEVTLSAPSALPVSVQYTTADGTAVGGQDYSHVAGVITFAPGETSKTIVVPILNDSVFEGVESFRVELYNPVDALIEVPAATVTVVDDGTGYGGSDSDTPGVISVAGATAVEGESLDFRVGLSHSATTPVDVLLGVQGGTATLGVDTARVLVSFDDGQSFSVVVGPVVSVPVGVTSFDVRVETVGDVVHESSEAITVSAQVIGQTAPVLAEGVIVDNDPLPVLSIVTPDLVLNEAAGVVTYHLVLDGQSDVPVSARVRTVAGTATAGADFEPLDTVVTFAPGQTEAFVSVRLLNDNVYEGAETFLLSLSQPAGLVLGRSVETTTIRDDGLGVGGSDNDLPAITITGGSFSEGAGHAVFSLHLSNASAAATTYDLALSGLTASPAVDFGSVCQVSLDGGASWVIGSSVTFAPGFISALVRVAIVDDLLNEFSEAFSLTATPSAGSVRSETVTGIATILDNDATPVLSIGSAVVNEQAGLVELTVTLSAASGKPVSVDYSTADDSATQWADYIPMFGTLSFAPGETTKTIIIPIEDDNAFEVSEKLNVLLGAPVNAVIGVGTGVVEIRDDGTGLGGVDNDIPGMIIGDVTVNEGAGFASFTVSLMRLATVPVSVNYATRDNTALVGVDYSSASGVVTFAPGQSSVTIQVPILQDSVFERAENFHVVLSAPVNGVIINGTGVGTILDDGAGQGGLDNDMPTLVVGDRVVNEAAGTVAISVSLSNPAAMPVTVNYATADGTARSGADYTAASGTLTFAPGQTTATVNVSIANDTVFERSEAFLLNLSTPVNASIADGVAIVTIMDDGTGSGGANDDTPAISINSLNVNEAIGTATFTVSMNRPADMPVTVSFATRAGTATNGLDYVGQTGTITFAPGEVSKTLGIQINQDTALELAESFFVDLTSPTNATIAQAVGECVINDNGTGAGGTDDDTPAFSINSVTINEDAGTATFTVSLDRSAGVPVSVNYATADGTALAGVDYTATSGTLTFAPGQTSRTITVSIANDGTYEGAENFSVNLSAASNATIAVASGLGTILDDGTGSGGTDDDRPQLTIGDIMVPESAGFAVFTASLSHPSTAPVQIALGLADVTATGGGVDYGSAGGANLQVSTDGGITWVSSTTATFAPGTTSVLVRTPVINDALDEVDESMRLTANVTAGTTINTTAAGVATIVDTTAAPDITINDVVVNEAAGIVTATVSMSAASAQTVMVTYISQDGTATSVSDYTPDAGTLTFAPGETVKTVSFVINNDGTFEGAEQFVVRLQGAINANILDGLGVMEIRDDGTGPGGVDNDAPLVSVSNMTVNEGSGPAVFAVSMSHPSTTPVDIALSLLDGTALLGQDYAAGMQISTDGGATWVAGSSFTMAPGMIAALVRVPVINDALDEWDEQFSLKATVTSGVTLNATAAGTGLILDDDAQPSLTIDSVTVNEGAGTATFTVSLDAPSGKTVTVDYASMDAAAQAGADYTAVAGTLSFAPGVVSQTITVAITNDALYEGSEGFLIGLSAASNATIAVASGLGTILDDGTGSGGTDDDRPAVKITGASVNEAIGTVFLTVQLDKPAAVPVTVNYASADGVALAGADYTAVSGTVTFAPGVTTQTIAVPIANDTVFEGPESFVVNLSGQTNSTLAPADAAGVVIIRDDGAGAGGTNSDIPTVSISSPSVLENAGFAEFTVSLSNASTTAVSVNLTSAAGTAALGLDYTSALQVSTDNGVTWTPSAAATFAPGATAVLVRAPIIDDLLDELGETFSVTATVASGATTNTTATGVATILDNDPTPSVSIDSVTVNEGTGSATLTLTLSAVSGLPVTVDYALAPGSATAPQDYIASTGTITFAPGVATRTIVVPIVNDTTYEGAESFSATLSNPTNATIFGAGVGVVTIMDDGTGTGGTNDDTPTVSVNSVSVNEDAGPAVFTVSLSNPSKFPIGLSLALAAGTAALGLDYTSALQVSTDGGATWVLGSSLTIPAGATSALVRAPVVNDLLDENNENFSLTATVTGGVTTNVSATGVATIVDMTPPPSVVINDITVNEGIATATFTVTLSAASAKTVSVGYASVNGSAASGADYTAVSGTLTFAPGVVSQTVSVVIANDVVYEGAESFQINLSAPVNVTIADAQGTGTIMDDGTGTGGTDNDRPSIVINDVTVNEAAGTATFTVTMSNAAAMPVTVDYATANGGALAGADYTATSGTLTFAAGVISQTVTVGIINDTTFEGGESFFVNLANPSNATIADAQGAGAIMDDGTGAGGTDNDRPSLIVNSAAVLETAGFAVFTVSLSNPTQTPVSLSLALAGVTATGGGVDYGSAGATNLQVSTDNGVTWANSTTATIAAGATSVLVRTPVIADALDENNETFSLTVTNLGATTTNSSVVANGVIIDTNAAPTLSISSLSVNEAIGTANLTVTLSAVSGKTVTVSYATAGVTAAAGADFTSTSGLLTFAPGEITKTVSVPIINDTAFEGAETLNVTLSGATNASIATANGLITINDDGTGTGGTNDDRGTVSVVGSTVDEAAGVVTFTLSLSSAQGLPVSVNYATADGTALAGADYTATSGTANFAAGQTTATVSVALINDRVVESTEAFQLNLTAPVNIHLGSSVATGTITDTDAAPVAASDSASGLNNVLLTGNVLINDSDPNGDPISVTGFSVGGTPYLPGASATIAGQGEIVINADGSYTFAPISTYVGNVSPITYTVSDGGNSTTSTLGITMTPGNAAPVVTRSLVHLSEEGVKYGHPDSVGAPVDMTNARIVTGTLNVVDPEGGPVTIDLVPLSSDSAPIFFQGPKVASWKSYDPTIFDPLSPAPGILLPSSYTGAASSKAIMLEYDGMPYLSLTIDDSGNYRAILMMDRSLAHAIPGVEDLLALGIGVRVSDGFNTTTVMNAIQLNVEDDSPVFTVSSSSQVIQQGTIVYGDLPEMGRYGVAVTLGADNYLSRSISSVQVDGVTYSFSPNLGVASASGSASWSYSGARWPVNSTSDGVLTVNTTSGGVLQLRASDGAYSYKAPSGLSSGYSEVLTYVVTDSDGDSAARSYSIDVSATSAMNVMSATSFDENLTGTGGRDAIYGSAGWDTLSGGLGDDFIYGGVGQDRLYGGGGSDVFVWGSDTFAAAEGQRYFKMYNRDYVQDYDVSPVSGGGDVIDLRGILWGESIALNNINDYIHINTTISSDRAWVSLSSRGDFSGGYVETKTSQAIDLIGGNLLNSALGLAAGATSAQIVAAMIAQGKLLVDN